jgi:glucose-6-phosphate isomerase
MQYSYKEVSRVSHELFDEMRARLEPERKRLSDILISSPVPSSRICRMPESFLRLPYDAEYGAYIDAATEKLIAYDPAAVIVCGIGGSHYGTAALSQFLGCGDRPLIFADTVDTDFLRTIVLQIQEYARIGRAVILLVISKSGATIETRANAALLYQTMKECYRARAPLLTRVIADDGAPIVKEAASNDIDTLLLPQSIGGRYSVFTAVGMMPLILAGHNRAALWHGAAAGYEAAVHEQPDNEAIIGATIRYAHAAQGATIHDTFIFGNGAYLLGEWYRQLMGESLGKKENRAGHLVETGITPTVSIGSNDLHSVTQLYLAGPRDKTTTFIFCAPRTEPIPILQSPFSGGLGLLPTTTSVYTALCDGTRAAFSRAERPFDLWHLSYSAHDGAYFMAVKMVEILYQAWLMNINPFDQPQVELYKEEIRRRLL